MIFENFGRCLISSSLAGWVPCLHLSKTEQVLFCKLSPRQRALYEAYLQNSDVKNVLRGSTQMLGAITMLRKICNHPDLVSGSDKASFESFVANGSVIEQESDPDDDYSSVTDEESLVEERPRLEPWKKRSINARFSRRR